MSKYFFTVVEGENYDTNITVSTAGVTTGTLFCSKGADESSPQELGTVTINSGFIEIHFDAADVTADNFPAYYWVELNGIRRISGKVYLQTLETPSGETDLTNYYTKTQTDSAVTGAKSRGNHTGVQSISTVTGLQTALDDKLSGTELDTHVSDTNNPHATTKAQVGLGNADNTSDAAKPVSSAQQSALDAKAPLASPAFTGTPTGITKAHVGLGNVDNTADSAKPVSTATQTALDGKASTTVVPDGGATDEALVKVNSTNRNTTWKRMLKWFGDIVTLPDSLTQFARINIPDDASDTATWPDRFAFYFNGIRTGYHNEYGEVRSRAAKPSTVALRAQGHASNTSTDVFQATSDDNGTVYFGAGPAGLHGPGTIRAQGSSQPSTTGWVAGEFWYDTSTEV